MLARGIGVFAVRSATGQRAASTAASAGEHMVRELSKKVSWAATGNAEFPYAARVAGRKVEMRINDFPEENLFSVVDTASGKDIFHANDMLPGWELPGRTPGSTPK